jgi:signal transduction histidine kinase
MDETERQFLHTIGDQIGMALSSISSQQRIEALLTDAQAKTRILQAQELEMRQNIVQLELTQQQMREFQQQLEVANNSLEQRVADRTQALEAAMSELQSAQNQVVLSEKMAALGQLVAGVAHEMNSPLGAIKASAVNMSDLLPSALRLIPELNQVLDDSQRALLSHLVETILAPREHLSSKEERKLRRQFAQELNDIGVQEDTDDMARRIVDAGFYGELANYMPLFTSGHGTAIADMLYSLGQLKLNLDNISLAADKTKKVVFALKSYTHTSEKHELTPTNLKEHIETVLVIYNNQLKYGIEVESVYPEDLPLVMTYSDELSQVWTNIIQNAIQAMNGVGNLRIEVTHDEANAFVRIIDSGPGIPPDKIEKIFEPFFTTKSRGEGTGLGLDIVRKIVRKHYGEISVESVPGRTCFIVRLPFTGQGEEAPAEAPAETVAA